MLTFYAVFYTCVMFWWKRFKIKFVCVCVKKTIRKEYLLGFLEWCMFLSLLSDR